METLLLAAADAVVVVHLLWIVFLILGALPGSRWPWVKWTHLAGLTHAIVQQAFDWTCSLTHLEVWLRKQAQSREGIFTRNYVEQIVYAGVPPSVALIGTAMVVVLSAWLYLGPRPGK